MYKVTIPAKGKVTVTGLASKQALKDMMAPTKIRVGYDKSDSRVLTIGRAHAWTIVHMLAASDTVTVHWEVFAGTGTCTSRCWDAKRFKCSCSCGGRRHISHLDWREIGHNWLEAILTLTPEEVAA